MADIKSTLDLVMERTKHLSLSTEEKANQKSAEVEKRINGLLQKLADSAMEVDELFSALDDLSQSEGVEIKPLLLRIIFDRIELDRDNTNLFTVLCTYCHINTARIEKIFADYRQVQIQKAAARVESARTEFAETHKISGSAVIPNLQTDQGWIDTLVSLKKDFQQLLKQEYAEIRIAGER